MERDIERRLIAIFAEHLGCDPDEISLDGRLRDDLDLDSLDSVELVMAIEDEFALSIHDEDAEKMETLRDIIAWIRLHLGDEEGGAGVGARLKGPRKPPGEASRRREKPRNGQDGAP